MAKPFVIGIAGKARSGKDTFAEALQNELLCHPVHWNVVRCALATPIKLMVEAMLSYANIRLDKIGKEEEIAGLGVSPRVLYQTLGTEWGRNLISKDLWPKLLDAALEGDTPFDVCIVTDIRFDNEAEWVDVLFQIDRKECEEVAEHASEAGIDPKHVTHHIRNDDDLKALRKKARAAAARIVTAYNESRKDD